MEKICPECESPFLPRTQGRPQKFCSRHCFLKAYYRHPSDTKETPRNAICGLCQTPFDKIKRNQRYCSRECYKASWRILNRDASNARSRKRRAKNPEWYAEREPIYASRYRAKLLTSRPWAYLFKSREAEARQKGLPFDLTHEWACARWTGCCEITGIKFRNNGKKGPYPFSPSLDKIDPKRGYTQDNSRFILWGCNAMKGVGTDADMVEIAIAITIAHKGLSLDQGEPS